MIGIQIRGIKHLHRLACEHDGVHGFAFQNRDIQEYYAFPYVKDGFINIVLLCDNGRDNSATIDLNNYLPNHRSIVKSILQTNTIRCLNIVLQLENPSPIPNGLHRGNAIFNFKNSTHIIVDNTFDKNYSLFLKENNKILSSTISKYLSSSNSPLGKLLYCLSDGNANFCAWGIKSISRYGISIYTIKHLLEFNSDYSQLVKNLTKQNLIALSGVKDTTQALEEAFFLRSQATAKQTVNWFNPIQKKLLRDKLKDNTCVSLLNNFSRLSKTKRINFIRKTSTITDVTELLQMMSFICTNSHFSWSKENLLEFIKNVENLNCNIVLDKDNIVIVQVHDYETIKRLGKMTNWCISKNRSYWNNYIGNASNGTRMYFEDTPYSRVLTEEEAFSQYDYNFHIRKENDYKNQDNQGRVQLMIFDFSAQEDTNESIVGVTVDASNGLIHNAHNFTNDNMLRSVNRGEERPELETIEDIETYINNEIWPLDNDEIKSEDNVQRINQIQKFLQDKEIDLVNLLGCQGNQHYDWNKESAKKYLSTFVDNTEINIWYEDESTLLFRCNSIRCMALLPSIVNLNRMEEYEGIDSEDISGYVMLLDFSKHSSDHDKIVFWRIFKNDYDIEAPSRVVYNSQCNSCNDTTWRYFSEMLNKYDIPFNILCRPSTINGRLNAYLEERNSKKIYETLMEASSSDEMLSSDLMAKLNSLIKRACENKEYHLVNSIINKTNVVKVLGQKTIQELLGYFFTNICTYSSSLKMFNSFVTDYPTTTKDLKTLKQIIFDNFAQKGRILSQKRKFIPSLQSFMNTMVYWKFAINLIDNSIKNGFVDVLKKSETSILDALMFYPPFSEERPLSENINFYTKLLEIYQGHFQNTSINTISCLFMFLPYSQLKDVVINRLSNFIDTTPTLKARHISKLLCDLNNVRSRISNELYHEVLNIISDAAKANHLMSIETYQRISQR